MKLLLFYMILKVLRYYINKFLQQGGSKKVIAIFRKIRHKIDVDVEKNITEQWYLIKYIEI